MKPLPQKSKPWVIYTLGSEHLDMRHEFILVGYDREPVFRWCCEQFGDPYETDSTWASLGVHFCFETEHDAFHFKMKWG